MIDMPFHSFPGYAAFSKKRSESKLAFPDFALEKVFDKATEK